MAWKEKLSFKGPLVFECSSQNQFGSPLDIGQVLNAPLIQCTPIRGSRDLPPWSCTFFAVFAPKTEELDDDIDEPNHHTVMIRPHGVFASTHQFQCSKWVPSALHSPSHAHGPCLWFRFGTNYGPVQILTQLAWVLILDSWVTGFRKSCAVPIIYDLTINLFLDIIVNLLFIFYCFLSLFTFQQFFVRFNSLGELISWFYLYIFL